MNYRDLRYFTNLLISKCEEGELDWETLARECLDYMSEDDVEDIADALINIDEDEEL